MGPRDRPGDSAGAPASPELTGCAITVVCALEPAEAESLVIAAIQELASAGAEPPTLAGLPKDRRKHCIRMVELLLAPLRRASPHTGAAGSGTVTNWPCRRCQPPSHQARRMRTRAVPLKPNGLMTKQFSERGTHHPAWFIHYTRTGEYTTL